MEYQDKEYNQLIQNLQSISDHPAYFTLINNQMPYQNSKYQTCVNLANQQYVQEHVINQTDVGMTSNQLVKYTITSVGSQILGQCKYLNAKIDSERAVEQEYVKQQKYCLWLVLIPVILFITSFLCHINIFVILSIVLMFFIFSLAIVNALHYKHAEFKEQAYRIQVPDVLGN